MKTRTFEVWLAGAGVIAPIVVTARRAIVTGCGRLKFMAGFFNDEVAAFNCGQWSCFYEQQPRYRAPMNFEIERARADKACPIKIDFETRVCLCKNPLTCSLGKTPGVRCTEKIVRESERSYLLIKQ